jgi:hypothetical protein
MVRTVGLRPDNTHNIHLHHCINKMRNKKCQTALTIPESNIKIVERSKIATLTHSPGLVQARYLAYVILTYIHQNNLKIIYKDGQMYRLWTEVKSISYMQARSFSFISMSFLSTRCLNARHDAVKTNALYHIWELGCMLTCSIYIYIYIYTTSEKPVNDQSYGVLDRYGITILYK